MAKADVDKAVREMIDGVFDPRQSRAESQAARESLEIGAMSEKALAKEIKRLEKQMLDHARNLEFEKAAEARDRLSRLKEQVLGASGAEPPPPSAGLVEPA